MGNVNMEASQINYRGGEKKMSVEEALKNTSGEAAAIAQLQTDVLNLNSNKANQITIAPFFSAETAYDPGDLVYYNGLSYRCVNAHEGEWDADDFAATTIAGEFDSLKSGLTNETTLLRQILTTTNTKYDLSGLISDYMFIAIVLGWYQVDSNDNMVVMPASAFSSGDYLLLYRKNDPSTNEYAKINGRGYADGVNFIYAEGTEGLSIKVVGIIHK